ncbi:uncharacterized protein EI97DRAFT_98936 [Westerdykella ornata]|uniref:Uncharacterized protein n=1 Tax=Westerdykella ornata TaxID=318751 RepID=A0A6A6JET9_WESOR|nr:uncharacterized protein EI97DRAFT_98936 [Westerdykella ornata]KAF2274754.1 hypothetical protein EI97DRAFT_98936 [Westerdykella ornata]
MYIPANASSSDPQGSSSRSPKTPESITVQSRSWPRSWLCEPHYPYCGKFLFIGSRGMRGTSQCGFRGISPTPRREIFGPEAGASRGPQQIDIRVHSGQMARLMPFYAQKQRASMTFRGQTPPGAERMIPGGCEGSVKRTHCRFKSYTFAEKGPFKSIHGLCRRYEVAEACKKHQRTVPSQSYVFSTKVRTRGSELGFVCGKRKGWRSDRCSKSRPSVVKAECRLS